MYSTGTFSSLLSGLTPETRYHFRAKAAGYGTVYGVDIEFTTGSLQSPNQPPNVGPAESAVCVSLPMTLQSGPFSDPDPGDTHAGSQWQVRTSTGSYASPVFDSGVDTVHLTSIALTQNELAWTTTYYWHVRYQDNHSAWSSWSTETMFTTADTPTGSPVTVIRTNTNIGFNQVTIGGCTWVTLSSTNPLGPIPRGFAVVGPFRDVVTTASYAGTITIGLPFDPSGIPDEQRLRLFHWNGFFWQDVTTSVDTTNDIVYGRVSSLSWFFIGGQWVEVQGGAGANSLPGLINVSLSIFNSFLSHFISGTASQFTLLDDGEWVVTPGEYQLTTKGEHLVGAISDVVTYGSVLLDWVTQALVGRIMGN